MKKKTKQKKRPLSWRERVKKDKKSYARFIKKNGNEPEFMSSKKEEKDAYKKAHDKWVAKWTKWSKE